MICMLLEVAGLKDKVAFPFLTNVPFLYPLKTPENQMFFGVFRRYKMGTLARNLLVNFLALRALVDFQKHILQCNLLENQIYTFKSTIQ